MSLSARNCNIPSLVSLAVGFFKTYFLDIFFSGAHLLRTLLIFRLEKVLVKMVRDRKFQPHRFLRFYMYTWVFAVIVNVL